MDHLNAVTVGMTLPAEYENAPCCAFGAVSPGKLYPSRGATRHDAFVGAILRGGVDGASGLHEVIRYAATMMVDGLVHNITDDERAGAARWVEKLGRHMVRHVVVHTTVNA